MMSFTNDNEAMTWMNYKAKAFLKEATEEVREECKKLLKAKGMSYAQKVSQVASLIVPEAESESESEAESEVSNDDEPEESTYRIDADTIDHSVCVGRSIVDEDRRWKPIVYYEGQCGGKPIGGSDLCKKCHGRQQKFFETGKQKDWNGYITEEPLPGCHMVGTQWAIDKKLQFVGKSKPKPASKPKVAKAPPLPAKCAVIKPVPEVKVAVAIEPIEVEGTILVLDGEMYIKVGNKMYEYLELSERTGDYVGRLVDEDTIDRSIPEDDEDDDDEDNSVLS
jgi:hypothetical protein